MKTIAESIRMIVYLAALSTILVLAALAVGCNDKKDVKPLIEVNTPKRSVEVKKLGNNLTIEIEKKKDSDKAKPNGADAQSDAPKK